MLAESAWVGTCRRASHTFRKRRVFSAPVFLLLRPAGSVFLINMAKLFSQYVPLGGSFFFTGLIARASLCGRLTCTRRFCNFFPVVTRERTVRRKRSLLSTLLKALLRYGIRPATRTLSLGEGTLTNLASSPIWRDAYPLSCTEVVRVCSRFPLPASSDNTTHWVNKIANCRNQRTPP